MIIQEQASGLLVATSKPTPPPEHSVRLVIRETMAKLAEDLCEFTHTTHGVMSDGSIESVCRRLVDCYENPSAYSISSLYQVLGDLAKVGAK